MKRGRIPAESNEGVWGLYGTRPMSQALVASPFDLGSPACHSPEPPACARGFAATISALDTGFRFRGWKKLIEHIFGNVMNIMFERILSFYTFCQAVVSFLYKYWLPKALFEYKICAAIHIWPLSFFGSPCAWSWERDRQLCSVKYSIFSKRYFINYV